jgi:hypothetical protein
MPPIHSTYSPQPPYIVATLPFVTRATLRLYCSLNCIRETVPYPTVKANSSAHVPVTTPPIGAIRICTPGSTNVCPGATTRVCIGACAVATLACVTAFWDVEKEPTRKAASVMESVVLAVWPCALVPLRVTVGTMAVSRVVLVGC